MFTYMENLKFQRTLALAICSSLERSDGHCIQVTVTWEVTSRWPKKWRHLKKNFEKFFFTFSGILGNFKRFHVKNFFSQVMSLEVTSRWPRKWRHLKWPSFERSDVTFCKWRADGQSQWLWPSSRHLKKWRSLEVKVKSLRSDVTS